MKIGGDKWFLGYYRVGVSWVLCLKAPHFGLIHLGHPVWWKPLALFPRAFIAHTKIVLQRT